MNRLRKTINIGIVLFVCLCTLSLLGCSDSEDEENTTGPDLAPSGIELLGLVHNRSLDYLQIDTTITWVPSYLVTEDTSGHIVRITGSADDWVITDDSTDILNLLVSDPYVSINGYWRKLGNNRTLVFLMTPAIIYDQTVEPGGSWEGYTEEFTNDSGVSSFPFHFGYFGFHYKRTYVGKEQVLVPAYVGSAYRYDIELFTDEFETEPVAVVSEFYVVGIGMVKSEFRAPSLIRIRLLRNYN